MLAGRRRWLLARLVAVGVGQAAAAIVTALLVQLAFDRLVATGASVGSRRYLLVAGGLVGAAALSAVLRAVERIEAERLGQHYVYQLRLVLYDRLTSLPPRTIQRRSQGAVALRFVGDITAVRQWVSRGLARLVVGATMVSGALAALAFISPVLAAGLAVVLASGAGVAFALGGRMRATARETRRRRSRLAANVTEQVGALSVVQAFGQSDRERRRVAKQSRRLRDASIGRAQAAGQLQGLTEATAALATGTALLLGAAEVGAGRASAGTVVAAMTIVGLLVPPLRDLGRVVEYRQNAVVSLQKIREFLETAEPVADPAGAPDLAPGPGRLAFADVRVRGSLDGVSAVAEPGTLVAVVGPNGAGKSTLLGVAARLVEPDAGIVSLDGQDLAAHRLGSVRARVAMAGPDLPLLRGSIGRNLSYRRPDAPPEELARIRELCGIDAVLAELPDGLETRVAEDGRGLSSGQRQRIALARALLGDPTVLLLDEADVNLDPQAAGVIDRVLAGFRGTVLLVTHRRERVAAADAVWHLEGGRLVADGPPEVLLAGGVTGRLFGGAPPAENAGGAGAKAPSAPRSPAGPAVPAT